MKINSGNKIDVIKNLSSEHVTSDRGVDILLGRSGKGVWQRIKRFVEQLFGMEGSKVNKVMQRLKEQIKEVGALPKENRQILVENLTESKKKVSPKGKRAEEMQKTINSIQLMSKHYPGVKCPPSVRFRE